MKVTPSLLFFFSPLGQRSRACFDKAENTDIIQTSCYPRTINNRLHFHPPGVGRTSLESQVPGIQRRTTVTSDLCRERYPDGLISKASRLSKNFISPHKRKPAIIDCQFYKYSFKSRAGTFSELYTLPSPVSERGPSGTSAPGTGNLVVDAGVEENVADSLHLSEIDHPRRSGLLAVQPHLFKISQLLSASAYLWAAEKSDFSWLLAKHLTKNMTCRFCSETGNRCDIMTARYG